MVLGPSVAPLYDFGGLPTQLEQRNEASQVWVFLRKPLDASMGFLRKTPRCNLGVARAAGADVTSSEASSPSMLELLDSHMILEELRHHFEAFTPELFANVATDASGLDRLLSSLSENIGADQFVVEARVRMLWRACTPAVQNQPKLSSSATLEAPEKQDSWTDTFPAKLSAATILHQTPKPKTLHPTLPCLASMAEISSSSSLK